jgi:HlyD family secretion protein
MATTAIEPGAVRRCTVFARVHTPSPPLRKGGKGNGAHLSFSPPCKGGVGGGDQKKPSHALLAIALLLVAGCSRGNKDAGKNPKTENETGKTAGTSSVHPERRDIRMTVVQPGTIQAFEVAAIYSRISGYVQSYRHNIGDRVKAGEVLLEMWIPDLVEQHSRRKAEVKQAEVQIRVTQSALRAAEARVETAKARLVSADAGVKRAQASYTRWESEYKRLETLVNRQVLDVQVRDETYRQFEEAVAVRDQANAAVSEMRSALDQAIADRERASVDVEAARAQLLVAQANEREARVIVEYGQIKSPYPGVVTQRNVSPGDYLQPAGGGGPATRPLFTVEQIDPVRIFVGVPELASFFIHEGDTAVIRFQALPGISREGKVVRSSFSMNPSTRTLQTEIDLPNQDGHLHPGWYVTVTIVVERKSAWVLPSQAVRYEGGQNYHVYLQVNGKPVRTRVIIGISDDTHTEILKKYAPNINTNEWPEFDGTEQVIVGNLDMLDQATATQSGR